MTPTVSQSRDTPLTDGTFKKEIKAAVTKHVDAVVVYTPKTGRLRGNRSVNEAFNRQYHQALMKKLHLTGIEVEETMSITLSPPVVFVKLHATWKFLERTAEILGTKAAVASNHSILSLSSIQKVIEKFVGFFVRPIRKDPPSEFKEKNELKMVFKAKYMQEYLDSSGPLENFFTASEHSKMVNYHLNRIYVSKNARDRRKGLKVPDENVTGEQVTFHWLHQQGVYDTVFVGHDCTDLSISRNRRKGQNLMRKSLRYWLYHNWAGIKCLFRQQPLWQIKEYFGSELSFYFAWLGHYTTMLAIPAFLSIISFAYGVGLGAFGLISRQVCSSAAANITICRRCPSKACHYSSLQSYCLITKLGQVFDNYSTLLFSVFISIWAVVFIEMWKRKQYSLAANWPSISSGTKEELMRVEYIFGVKGKKISPITHKEEPHMKRKERIKRTVISYLIGIFILTVVVINTAGLIIYKKIAVQYYESHRNAFIDFVSPSILTSFTASGFNLIFITIMSFIYGKIAKRMTEYECPETQSEFDSSYTLKVMVFQFFNYYGTLFYMVFVHGKLDKPPHLESSLDERCGPEGCMSAITIQLIVVMTGKQLFQNFTEYLTPVVRIWLRKLGMRKGIFVKKRKKPIEKDYLLLKVPKPTAFNDYQEMVLQYGFITMFAPAFPLGAFFAFLNNIIEIRTDALKYCTEYQRPMPGDTSSIGPWMAVLENMTRISLLVNALLIAFSGTSIELLFYGSQIKPTGISLFDFSFSFFNTSDYLTEEAINSRSLSRRLSGVDAESLRFDFHTNQTIETCYYRGQFFPSTADTEHRYTHTESFTSMLVIKLAFVIAFENVVFFIQDLVRRYMPPQSQNLKYRIQRENILHRLIVEKYALRSTPVEPSDTITVNDHTEKVKKKKTFRKKSTPEHRIHKAKQGYLRGKSILAIIKK